MTETQRADGAAVMTLLSPSTIRNLKLELRHLSEHRAALDAHLRSIQIILREYPIHAADDDEASS